MSRYAIVLGDEIMGYVHEAPNVDQSLLAPGKPRRLPVEIEQPAFDPESQILTGPELVIGAHRVVERWVITERPVDERKAAMTDAVNAERDRRIRSPFPFGPNQFDYDSESQKRITGAASLAGFAMSIGGKQPGDPLWHGGDEPFVWIAADNVLVHMDAATTFAFGQAAAAWESAHIFAARALKDAIEVAADHAALDLIDIDTGWSV